MTLPTLPLSDPVFAILRALIEDASGIHYAEIDRELLSDKLSTRAIESGFDSLLDYYYYLRYDEGGGRELEQLLDALVVGETYFFRELDQQLVVVEMLERSVAEGHRPRVWSAACATGEEPVTLAMLLADRGLLGRVDLVATDLSARALARARSGSFGRRSIRGDIPPPFRKWLDVREGIPVVRRELVDAIDFRRVNLVDRERVEALGCFDVILCRNVLIYFQDDAVRRVVDTLTHALTPGGALFVGVSESLMRFGTSLVCEEWRSVFFYRKAESRP